MNLFTRSISATLMLLCLLAALPVAATLTQVAERRLNTDSNEEFEPTAVSYVSNSVEYNAVVYMRFPSTVQADPNSTFQVRTWNSGGGTATSTIPAHMNYPRYVDPVLVKDDGSDNLFLVGLGINGTNRGLLVWVSTNHGVSWTGPDVFATSTTMDKPVATMTGSVLWIAYIQSGLRVIRSPYSSGAWTIGTPIAIDNTTATGTTTTGQNPQIMVDNNGDIYLFYMNDLNQFGLMRAAVNTTTFSRVTTTAVGTLYTAQDTTTQWLPVKTNTPQIYVRGITVPVAKLDRSRRRISIAWHETSGTGSRIRFLSYRTDLGTWSSATTVADGGGHEINPGMDFNPANGNYVVTWYSFSPAGTHAQYHQYGSYVTFDGSGNPVAEQPSSVRSRPGDAANLSQTPATRTYVGDYHDVAFSNGTWKAIHLVAPQRNWDGTLTETSDHWAFTVSH